MTFHDQPGPVIYIFACSCVLLQSVLSCGRVSERNDMINALEKLHYKSDPIKAWKEYQEKMKVTLHLLLDFLSLHGSKNTKVWLLLSAE